MTQRSEWHSIIDSIVGQQIFRTIFDSGPIGITISAPDRSPLRYANQRLCDMLGYTREEFETRDLELLTHPDDRDLTRRVSDQLDNGEIKYFQIEKRYICKDGNIIWAFVTGFGVQNTIDNSRYTAVMIEDISERKRAEAALQLSEERYRQLFNSNPQPVFVYDLVEYKLLAFNSAASRYYGYQADELVQMNFLELFAPSNDHEMSAWFDEPIPNRTTLPKTFEHMRKNGSRFPVEVTRRYLSFDERPACLSVIHDISIQRAAEQERDQAYQTLERRVIERTQQIDQRRKVAESLRHTISVLNRGDDAHDLLDFILEQAADLLGGCAGVICSLLSEQICNLHSTRNIHTTPQIHLYDFPGWQQLLDMTQTGQPISVINADDSEWDYSTVLVDMPTFASLLALPLKIRNQTEYGLILYYAEQRHFASEDLQVALSFADQSALAIESRLLRQQVKQIAIAEERNRLARDLHDSVTQQLYSISLVAEGLRRLDKVKHHDIMEEHLANVGNIATQALREMRLLIYELRPDMLEKEGLIGALHHRLATVEQRSGMHTRVITDTLTVLPSSVEEVLFRIAQEALNNIVKHADATSITLSTSTQNAAFILEIQDDGRGFDPARIRHGGGMGLIMMQERATQIGGSVTIDTIPDEGTCVRITVPLEHHES